MKIAYTFTISLVIFIACSEVSKQNAEQVKIQTDTNSKAKKDSIKIDTIPQILIPDLKAKCKFQNLTKFEIQDYRDAERLELVKIDSLTAQSLQIYERRLKHSYGGYFYAYQTGTENYDSIVILINGFESTHVLIWLNYSKQGDLIDECILAHFDGEGGATNKGISTVLSPTQIQYHYNSIWREKNEIIEQSKNLITIQEDGTFKDSSLYEYKNEKYFNYEMIQDKEVENY